MSITNLLDTASVSIASAKEALKSQVEVRGSVPVVLNDGTVVSDPSDVHLYHLAPTTQSNTSSVRTEYDNLFASLKEERAQIDAYWNDFEGVDPDNPMPDIERTAEVDALLSSLPQIDLDQLSGMPISEQNPLDKLNLTNEGIVASMTWLPPEMAAIAQLHPELAAQLQFLSLAATMPLDQFQSEFWNQASRYPQFDWVNDGCSVPRWLGKADAVANGMEVPCIRHDFAYRNFERIDAQFGLNGLLLESHGAFENIADDQLGEDADDVSSWRSRLVETGVELPGSGADSYWEEPADWYEGSERNIYGNGGFTPDTIN